MMLLTIENTKYGALLCRDKHLCYSYGRDINTRVIFFAVVSAIGNIIELKLTVGSFTLDGACNLICSFILLAVCASLLD